MITHKNLDEQIKRLEKMGDTLPKDATYEQIKEFEDLADEIEAFENEHFQF